MQDTINSSINAILIILMWVFFEKERMHYMLCLKSILAFLFFLLLAIVFKGHVLYRPLSLFFSIIIFKFLYKSSVEDAINKIALYYGSLQIFNCCITLIMMPILFVSALGLSLSSYNAIYDALRCFLFPTFLYAMVHVITKLNQTMSKIVTFFFLTFIVITDICNAIIKGKYSSIALCIVLIFLLLMVAAIFLFKEQKKQQQELDTLNTYVHQSKEILPAVGKALNRLSKESGKDSHQIIEELTSMYQEQLKINKQENRDIKAVRSTGSILIDEQIKGYLGECADAGIDLDVFIGKPITELLSNPMIESTALLRMIGDLYRNAYKAVLKRGDTNKRILICFGELYDGTYEIAFYDNGIPFPDFVLKNLGERGVTTDGTGNGIADTFSFLDSSHASFFLKQLNENEQEFTKELCIQFDEKHKIEIV